MYQDNVRYEPLLAQPRFVLVLFAALAALFWALGAGSSIFEFIFNSDGALQASMGPVVGSLGLALLLTANFVLIGRLSVHWQVPIVWLELATLFFSFFVTFNLSLPFILSKVAYLITQGVVMTIELTAISISIAFVLALFGAVAKLSSNGFAIAIASFYTSFFRGVPLLIQIYLIYMGLPQLGYVIEAFPAGVIALSLCYGAYMTEIFRAGIMSIPKGQWEASRALGLSPWHTLSRVILPQAMRVIVPPTGNQFIAMLKDSSLVSVIGVWELMFLAKTEGRAEFRHLEMLVTASVIYWLLSIILERVQHRIEAYFNRSNNR